MGSKSIIKPHIIGVILIAAFAIIAQIFMVSILSSIYPFLYVAFVLIAFGSIFGRRPFVFDRISVMWILSEFVLFFSAIHSVDNALNFAIGFGIILACCIILKDIDTHWKKVFAISISLFSSIHVIATIAQFINPTAVAEISKRILSNEQYILNQHLLKSWGSYAGITGQTARNGWLISIFLGAIIVWLLHKNSSKFIKILCFAGAICSYIAIFLTHKRSFILFPVVCVIVILTIQGKINIRDLWKIVLGILVLYFIYKLLCAYIPEIETAMSRFDVDEGSDYTTGRTTRWINTLKVFGDYPLFGVGLLNISPYINSGYTHNSYIQILAETGLGGIIIIVSMFFSLGKSINNYKYVKATPNEYYILLGIYYQILYLLYAMVGNPFTDIQMTSLYLVSIFLCYIPLKVGSGLSQDVEGIQWQGA